MNSSRKRVSDAINHIQPNRVPFFPRGDDFGTQQALLIGVDILEPVQVKAMAMVPAELKRK